MKEPKTRASKAPVPVIAQLAEKLNAYREQCGWPQSWWMFPNSVGKPMCLDKLARDVIRPAFKASGIEWHGWHAFRRGLATNLYELGVPDLVIQAILRHSDVNVTRKSYIKAVRTDVIAAMNQLENTLQAQTAGVQVPREVMN